MVTKDTRPSIEGGNQLSMRLRLTNPRSAPLFSPDNANPDAGLHRRVPRGTSLMELREGPALSILCRSGGVR
jgi:hypothetical protein